MTIKENVQHWRWQAVQDPTPRQHYQPLEHFTSLSQGQIPALKWKPFRLRVVLPQK